MPVEDDGHGLHVPEFLPAPLAPPHSGSCPLIGLIYCCLSGLEQYDEELSFGLYGAHTLHVVPEGLQERVPAQNEYPLGPHF